MSGPVAPSLPACTPLGADDVARAFALSGAEGWNQTRSDWERLLRLEPDGCFAARDAGGELTGTVTTTTYGGALGWIGMMVVQPACRGRGIGAALMRSAIAHLRGRGVARIGLDATPAGRPLYEWLGFRAVAPVERWQGVATLPAGAASMEIARAHAEDARALDAEAHDADRARLLDALAAESGHGFVSAASSPDGGTGFAMSRPGRVARYLGPIVATDARAAERLLDAMLALHAGEEVCLDVLPGGFLSTVFVASRGLALRRGLTRMELVPGPASVPSPRVCASAGPEYG